MEPVRHRRFPGCSLARHALQHGSDATSPACTDSVFLRALTLHCAHHTFGATEESPSTVAKHRSTVELPGKEKSVFFRPVNCEEPNRIAEGRCGPLHEVKIETSLVNFLKVQIAF